MYECHGLYYLYLADFSRMMHAGHDWCRPVKAHGCCVQALADASFHWSISPWSCAHDTTDVIKSICTRHNSCVQALDNFAFNWPMSFGRGAHATLDALNPRLKSPIQCAQDRIDVFMPYIMMHVLATLPATNVHGSLGLCHLPLDDVACQRHTLHVCVGRLG